MPPSNTEVKGSGSFITAQCSAVRVSLLHQIGQLFIYSDKLLFSPKLTKLSNILTILIWAGISLLGALCISSSILGWIVGITMALANVYLSVTNILINVEEDKKLELHENESLTLTPGKIHAKKKIFWAGVFLAVATIALILNTISGFLSIYQGIVFALNCIHFQVKNYISIAIYVAGFINAYANLSYNRVQIAKAYTTIKEAPVHLAIIDDEKLSSTHNIQKSLNIHSLGSNSEEVTKTIVANATASKMSPPLIDDDKLSSTHSIQKPLNIHLLDSNNEEVTQTIVANATTSNTSPPLETVIEQKHIRYNHS